jgi:hypothetical protein
VYKHTSLFNSRNHHTWPTIFVRVGLLLVAMSYFGVVGVFSRHQFLRLILYRFKLFRTALIQLQRLTLLLDCLVLIIESTAITIKQHIIMGLRLLDGLKVDA